MLGSVFFAAAVLLEVVAAASPSKRYLAHTNVEKRSVIPSGWNKRDGSSSSFNKKSMNIPVRINLRQNDANLARADDLLMSVSSPHSEKYGQHYTAKQVADLFAPAKDSVDSVLAWLEDAGFGASRVKYSKGKGSVLVTMTVSEAEDLLHADYDVYEHSNGQPHVACKSYSVPQAVREHIDFVTPTLHFDVPLGKRGHSAPVYERADGHKVASGVAKSIGKPGAGPVDPKTTGSIFSTISAELADCDAHITPICLEALYKFEPFTQLASKKNSYGIVEYTPQAYIPSDLDVFSRNFSTRTIGYRPFLASIDGGYLVPGPPDFNYNGESNLDLQYGMALVAPVNITLYQVGDDVEGASFNNLLDALDSSFCSYEGGNDPTQDGIYPDPYDPSGFQGQEECGKFKPTNVISTSYAYNEADLTPFYEQRQCNEYMKLGLMGVSVLYSSGDYGVAGNGGDCIVAGTGEYSVNGTIFNPSFPGTCPYITAVGATQVNPGAKVTDPESACEQVIYSGGGFSNVFPTPSYQKAALATYFKDHKPSYTAAQYNNSQITRGFPDISANGANYLVSLGGVYHRVFGTSASSPVVGSIITLLNDARLAIGKKPVGFINPVLYANAWALNDITSGGNQGCGTPGFTAVKGWDPVTGLGTPNFPKLLITLLALP